tara:strand:- start:236 stop:619 length:384 start_codon:yes stop_codon:yes gene_type:complete
MTEKNLNFNCVECRKIVDFPDEDCMGEHCLTCYWLKREIVDADDYEDNKEWYEIRLDEYDINEDKYGISIRSERLGQHYRLVLQPHGHHYLECSEKYNKFILWLKDKDIIGLKKVIDLYLKDMGEVE